MNRTPVTGIKARLIAINEQLQATYDRVEEQLAQGPALRRQSVISRQAAVETRQRTQQLRQSRHAALTLQAAPAPVPAGAVPGRPYSRQLCPRHGNVSLNRYGTCPGCFCAEQARGALAGNPRLIVDRCAN